MVVDSPAAGVVYQLCLCLCYPEFNLSLYIHPLSLYGDVKNSVHLCKKYYCISLNPISEARQPAAAILHTSQCMGANTHTQPSMGVNKSTLNIHYDQVGKNKHKKIKPLASCK